MALMRHAALLILGLVSASPTAAQRRVVRDTLTPRFAESIDHLAAAVGLRPLRTDSAWRGTRELRMWIGFGIYVPQGIIRFVETDAGVTGQYILWWYPNDAASESAADRDSTLTSNTELYAWMRREHGCGERKQGPDYEYCEASVPDTVWASVLRRLDSLSVMRLPDESVLNPPVGLGMDGTTLVVEARTQERYRTYAYWTPRPDAPHPEVRLASEILAAVYRMVRHGE